MNLSRRVHLFTSGLGKVAGRPDANSHPPNKCHCSLFQEGTLTVHIRDLMNLETARLAAPASTVQSEGSCAHVKTVCHDIFLYKLLKASLKAEQSNLSSVSETTSQLTDEFRDKKGFASTVHCGTDITKN